MTPTLKFPFSAVCILLGLLSTATQFGFAQSPLNFGNNFFVTGDYIVAGAYNVNQKFTTVNGNSYTVGTINVPDTKNPGIMGATSVPTGAQIVAALLYWQTVEKVGVAPGAPGSGQNGYFRPLLYQNNGGPAAPGYAISGINVSGSTAVSWSSGGCGGTSTGKVLKTYRADVLGGLPNDAHGNPTPNGSFQVVLPSIGNSTPLTLGATLVVIYRIPSVPGGPNVPLNAIVVYDGAYSQSTAQLTMTQQLQGFYDADAKTISRLTHIVGSGQSNKFQTVYLSSGTNPFTKLSSLYGNKLPAFPGWYGTWDNPTWTFSNGTSPLSEDSSIATTQVVPTSMNQGCVSWGAVIMSTTVRNPDNDGILYSWKDNQGYCDVATNTGSCNGPGDPAWVDLSGAAHGKQDVFLQYDYMCSKVTGPNSCTVGGVNNDYSFDPRLATDLVDGQTETAIDKVVKSYANNNGSSSVHSPIVLHPVLGNAIEENQPNITCPDSDLTCPFPNEPGTVGFRYGLENIKNSNIETSTGVIGACTPGTADPTCVPVFQYGKKDSYHYALFSHGVGLPRWFLFDGSISSVQQAGNTVTFTTPSPHGVAPILMQTNFATATDVTCPSGRVTVEFALNNPNLNGTFCAKNVTSTTFQITVPGSPMNFSYTANNEPYLGFANGQVTSMSGFSDVGGQNVVVALGFGGWGPAYNPASDGNKWQVKAGTFMHELGHNLGLTHGGTFYNNYNPPANTDYTPTFEPNCKPNVQTVMSYLFQFDLLQVPGMTNPDGSPKMIVDYSEDSFAPTLTKNNPQALGVLSPLPYANTASFQLTSYAGTVLTLSAAAKAAGGTTVYTGTITGGANNALSGRFFTVAGFKNTPNNGLFVVTASTTTTLTLNNAFGIAESHAATASSSSASAHCDGSPILPTDPDQPMTYVQFSPTSGFFWGDQTGLDINFDGNTSDVMHPHDEWTGVAAEVGVGPSPGLDLRQISAIGTLSTGGAGGAHLGTGGGGAHLGTGGGGAHLGSGGGGAHLGSGGGGAHLGTGGGALSSENTHESANSYPRPARTLTAQEQVSPRYIVLNWFAPTFGTVVQYNVYRSVAGGTFTLLASVPGNQTTFTDKTDSCNPGGYSYEVTSVTQNDSRQMQESVPSNTVPASGQPMTGCYTNTPPTPPNLNNLSFTPSSTVQGSAVSITWSLQDDDTSAYVNGSTTNYPLPLAALTANSLYAIGPVGTISNNTCTNSSQGRIALVLKGAVQNSAGTFSQSGNTFTFAWATDAFCAGSYTFELDTDSSQIEAPAPALKLSIDVNDQDNLNITTVALPSGTVGLAYPTYTLTEEGGTPSFNWTVTGLPNGIAQQSQYSPTILGMTCSANAVGSPFPVGVSVTDSRGNTGSQGFSLQINKANTTTLLVSSGSPSVFQQALTYTVNVTPQYGCVPTGTVTLYDGQNSIASAALSANGTATFTIPLTTYNPLVGVHSMTAQYSGDSNFNSSTSAVWSQTINKASTSISFNLTSPSPAFVGQPISVSYTSGIVSPGAASPIPPSGNVMVTSSDGSTCLVPATSFALGGGMCTLSPPPAATGTYSLKIIYNGDSSFVGSADNSAQYNVNQLVFTTQPSNTGVGLTMPTVVVTAEDPSNNTLTNFAGNITLAIGSGPGILFGTLPQPASAGVATFSDLSVNQVGNGYTLTASPAVGVLSATSNSFNIDTFYVDSSYNFGTLDLPTGTTTQISSGTLSGATGLDLTPGGQVFEYNTSNQLMQITPATGAVKTVGLGTLPHPTFTTTGALTDGTYYGIDAQTGSVYKIDTSIGATNLVFTPTIAIVPNGCNYETSLSGSGSLLYYTVGVFIPAQNPASCTLQANVNDTLYVIDPVNQTTTAGVQLSGNGFVGSAFVGGTLYGFNGTTAQEYTINTSTGAAIPKTATTVVIYGAGSSQ